MTVKDSLTEKRQKIIEDYAGRIAKLRAKQIALAQKILANAN